MNLAVYFGPSSYHARVQNLLTFPSCWADCKWAEISSLPSALKSCFLNWNIWGWGRHGIGTIGERHIFSHLSPTQVISINLITFLLNYQYPYPEKCFIKIFLQTQFSSQGSSPSYKYL